MLDPSVGTGAQEEPVGRFVGIVLGVLLVLMGVVFTLQGLGYVGGSAMTGVTLWAVLGPIIAVVGVILLVVSLRRGRRA
jgi:hypothetical protein